MSTPTSIPFTVLSITRALEDWRPALRARARVKVADVLVVELEVLEARNVFVAYPSRKEKRHGEDAWTSIVELLNRDFERSVFAAVRKAYGEIEARSKASSAPEPQDDQTLPPADNLPF